MDFFLLRLELITLAAIIAAIIAMMLITAGVIAALPGAARAVGDGRAVADGETLGETLADGAGVADGDALGFGVAVGLGEGEAAAVTVIFAASVYSHSPSSLLNRQATDQPFMP